jgi:DNA polymerase-3 subunit epsilon
MKFLIFDTETTGLPKTKLIQDLHLWPYIVQFSYIIFDSETNQISLQKDWIVKLEKDVIIDEKSKEIHGITNEISNEKGVDLKNCLDNFFEDAKYVDMIIGHNLNFDINMIKVELLRLIRCEEISQEIKKKYTQDFYFIINYNKFYCTMKKSIELCNIIKYNATGKQYLKYPKLSELHKKLFDSEPNHLHNSYNDVLVTLRCFMKLKNDVDIYTNCIQFKNIVDNLSIYNNYE